MSLTTPWKDKLVDNEKADYVVYIGRFQPFHMGHYLTIKDAMKYGEKIIICIGSHDACANIRNPWSSKMRKNMIMKMFTDEERAKIYLVFLRDHPYDNQLWIQHVRHEVNRIAGNKKVKITGYRQSDTDYISWFREWPWIPQDKYIPLNGTDIRYKFFVDHALSDKDVPDSTIYQLTQWKSKFPDEFKRLELEYLYVEEYKNEWVDTPFPVNFVAADSIVLYGEYIAMIQRKGTVGHNTWAIPGGFVDTNETVLQAALRELKEEIGITPSTCWLKHTEVIDCPDRDLRGRIISHVHVFVIPTSIAMPQLKSGDDAKNAKWLTLDDIMQRESNVVADHIYVLKKVLLRRF